MRAFDKFVDRGGVPEILNELKDLLRCTIVCADTDNLHKTLHEGKAIIEEHFNTVIIQDKNGWDPVTWKKNGGGRGAYVDVKRICKHEFGGKPVYSEIQFTIETLWDTNHKFDEHGFYNIVRQAGISLKTYGKCLWVCDPGIIAVYDIQHDENVVVIPGKKMVTDPGRQGRRTRGDGSARRRDNARSPHRSQTAKDPTGLERTTLETELRLETDPARRQKLQRQLRELREPEQLSRVSDDGPEYTHYDEK